jgi:hypothetical protein
MQTHRSPNRSDSATFDRDRLIGCNGDSGIRNLDKSLPHPVTRLIPSRKRIALVAHENREEQLASWALKHRTRLIEQELYATSHTADIISDALSVPVFRLLSGPSAPIHESRLRLGDLLKTKRSAERWWSSDKADWKSVVVT